MGRWEHQATWAGAVFGGVEGCVYGLVGGYRGAGGDGERGRCRREGEEGMAAAAMRIYERPRFIRGEFNAGSCCGGHAYITGSRLGCFPDACFCILVPLNYDQTCGDERACMLYNAVDSFVRRAGPRIRARVEACWCSEYIGFSWEWRLWLYGVV